MTWPSVEHPELLWLLLLVIPVVALGWYSLRQVDGVRKWSAIGLRAVVLITLVLMLAGLRVRQSHDELTVIAVVDTSASVRAYAAPPDDGGPGDDEAGEGALDIEAWTQDWLRSAAGDAADGRRADDLFGWLTYDDRPTLRAQPTLGTPTDAALIQRTGDGTDTQAALEAALRARSSSDAATRLVLISDGNDTSGDALAAAELAASQGIPIDVVPLRYAARPRVVVEHVAAPAEAREGQAAAVRVVMRATEPMAGQLQLSHDQTWLDLNGEAQQGTGLAVPASAWVADAAAAEATGNPVYRLARTVDVPLQFSGPNRFEAVFEPDARAAAGTGGVGAGTAARVDAAAGTAFTMVEGRGRLLVVDNLPGDSGAILPQALRDRGLEVQVVPPHQMPDRLPDMMRYDAIVLQNVSSDLMNPTVQDRLARYVHDLGGGLVMTGGPDSFGAGGWANSPVEAVLPVTATIPSQTVMPSGALLIVMDRSGSMGTPVGATGRSQLDLAGEASILAINTLFPQDLAGVVVFDSSAHWIVRLEPNRDPQATASAIRAMQAGGGTNIYSGLRAAVDAMQGITFEDAALKHIILLSDGHSGGSGYTQLIQEMMQNNISLTTVGVGNGHNAQLLTQWAQMTGGNYHAITGSTNLPQIFIKEAQTLRRNLVRESPEGIPLLLQRTGSTIAQPLTAVPPVQGLVLVGRRPDPRAMVPIVTDDDVPVFAHWQVGLGRSAAFTSDAANRWSTPWLTWDGFGDFWARTLRYVARPSASRDADLAARVEGNTLTVSLDVAGDTAEAAGSADQGFGDFLSVRGGVQTPSGDVVPVTLEQVAPGRYRAQIPADQDGSYIVSLMMDSPDGERRSAFGGAARPPGRELRRFEPNAALLNQIAQMTGGRVLDPAMPETAGLFDRTQAFETVSTRPLRWVLLPALLVLLLLDVANRRVAWSPAGTWSTATGWVGGLAGSMRRGEQRQEQQRQTLGALKAARDRAAAGHGKDPEQPAEVRVATSYATGTAATAKAAASRKFNPPSRPTSRRRSAGPGKPTNTQWPRPPPPAGEPATTAAAPRAACWTPGGGPSSRWTKTADL